MGARYARGYPEEAALRCRSGTEALKGNLPEKASISFRQALALNPLLWEAFEGLCSIGMCIGMCSLKQSYNVPSHMQGQYLRLTSCFLHGHNQLREVHLRASPPSKCPRLLVLDSSLLNPRMVGIPFVAGDQSLPCLRHFAWAHQALHAILCKSLSIHRSFVLPTHHQAAPLPTYHFVHPICHSFSRPDPPERRQ